MLAGSRGLNDPIAQYYGLTHKCLLPIDGIPMLRRVVDAARQSAACQNVYVSVESSAVIREALGDEASAIHVASERSAPTSAIAAAKQIGSYPILITTGDHALLTPDMVNYVFQHSVGLGADVTVGLATREVIQKEYPETKRTYFRFRDAAVSGCNLFTIHNARGLRLLETWADLEQNRKRPWLLAFSFGVWPLFRFASGTLSLGYAFDTISRKCDMIAKPLLLPFAEAAIDVDKPSDKDLADEILVKRRTLHWTESS